MEAAVKCDEFVAPGGVSRQLDGAFDRLGPRIGEEDLLAFRARHGLGQAFRELRHALVIKIRTGHVNQLGGLLLNGGGNFWMAVSARSDGETRREVQKN